MTIYIFIPGILTVPGGASNWTGRAVTWTHLHSEHKAEKVEYLSGVVTRPFREGQRTEKLTRTMEYYIRDGWSVVLTGHSNGCDVILDSLKAQGYPKLHGLHMISGACEADFEKSGLNKAEVDSITVWIGANDKALGLAGTFAGKLLGYGTLGRDGAKNAKVPVTYIRKPFSHGEWFEYANFDNTMRTITGNN